MSNAIERSKGQIERTWDGKRVRCDKQELLKALAPMFATFPNLEMSDDTFNAYYMMLCDLDPNKLIAAVITACKTHEYPTQLITVAAIRKAYEGEQRPPGPWSEKALEDLPPVPCKFFRLDEEEDRQQRLERLRQTRHWDKYYA